VYNPVNEAIIAELRGIAGAEQVLTNREAMEPYSHDEVVGLRADPEIVVRVSSSEQVAAILQAAKAGGKTSAKTVASIVSKSDRKAEFATRERIKIDLLSVVNG
jgi:hypothetical protein